MGLAGRVRLADAATRRLACAVRVWHTPGLVAYNHHLRRARARGHRPGPWLARPRAKSAMHGAGLLRGRCGCAVLGQVPEVVVSAQLAGLPGTGRPARGQHEPARPWPVGLALARRAMRHQPLSRGQELLLRLRLRLRSRGRAHHLEHRNTARGPLPHPIGNCRQMCQLSLPYPRSRSCLDLQALAIHMQVRLQ